MRHVPNDKYTIAWFKLAECIAKGEKEKAFGVYRLLSHSLEDQAYAYQLEGDLLDAFQDGRAPEKYAQAAHVYHHTHRYKEACALYEELIFLLPHDDKHLTRLLEIYKSSKSTHSLQSKLSKLAYNLLEKKMVLRAFAVAQELKGCADVHAVAPLYTAIVVGLLQLQSPEVETILFVALDYLLEHNDQRMQALFLTTLEQMSGEWYARALNYLKKT